MRTRFPKRESPSLTHSQLVEIAERWLNKTKGCGVVFTELRANTHNGEIPDAIGFRSGISILVECKSNRSDFLSDKNKRFRKQSWRGMGDFRFYMAPKGVIQKEELPKGWGLVVVNSGGKARQVEGITGNIFHSHDPSRFQELDKWSEVDLMYSALRRIYKRGLMSVIYEPFDSYMGEDHE